MSKKRGGQDEVLVYGEEGDEKCVCVLGGWGSMRKKNKRKGRSSRKKRSGKQLKDLRA